MTYNFLKKSSLFLIWIGIIISVVFFCILSYEYKVSYKEKILMAETGQVGDFIGGIVGTLFALSGTILIYLSFKSQTKQNKREAFEATFFEMLKIHRENVAELSYSKFDGQQFNDSNNRKVFRLIYGEFIECFHEVNKFYRTTSNILTPEYTEKLKLIIDRINPQIELKELAMVDIAYSIVFFGIGEEGDKVLRFRFRNKYEETNIFQLLQYIKLKPKRENQDRFKNWEYISSLEIKQIRIVVEDIYNYKRNSKARKILTEDELKYLTENKFEKYYGGHQFRLGHYYRHLFQAYKYLHLSKNISAKNKYFYAKTLRAQLSSYEQAMLFINSISTLGMKWEFTPDFDNTNSIVGEELNRELTKHHLISNYQLIKNLPGERLFGLKYKTYYPSIRYEFEE